MIQNFYCELVIKKETISFLISYLFSIFTQLITEKSSCQGSQAVPTFPSAPFSHQNGWAAGVYTLNVSYKIKLEIIQRQISALPQSAYLALKPSLNKLLERGRVQTLRFQYMRCLNPI